MGIRLKRIGDHSLPLPSRASAGAIGYDLSAVEDAIVRPGASALVGTGFAWELDPASDIPGGGVLPVLTGGLIRDRSSVTGSGLFVVAGVIDADYRGEIKVRLFNNRDEPVAIKAGERIAQILITSFLVWDLVEIGQDEALTPTARDGNGFGSTGL